LSGFHSSPTLTFTGTGAFSGSTSNSHGALGIYSMIEGVTIAFNGPGTSSFDYSADNTLVPEPSSLTLAGLGLLGLVGYGLRRRKALGA
jgi:MYXO-CTERM domain-containing protein